MKKKREHDREQAVKCYLQGESIAAIAKKLGYTRPWVYKWTERFKLKSTITSCDEVIKNHV